MENFKHKMPVQIRFADIDMMKHVNHANYLNYVELARLRYYDEVIGTEADWHLQHGLIMARSEIDYKKPVEYDDIVFVYSRCSRLGNSSFDMTWKLTTEKDGVIEVAAEGKSVIVCYDYSLKKAIEIPADKKKKINIFEGLDKS